jgi:type I restriction enzyme M protein
LSRHSVTTPDGGTIGDIMVFGQDQWAWGAHLRRAQRARRVRLRRKQPNQSNPTTWRLAAMNMAIRGIDFDFGKEPADTFTRDQHPDLRADFVMALPSAVARSLPRSHFADRPIGRINPPFNIKEWWDGKLEGDARWKYGTPPQTATRECAPLKSEGTPQVVSEARDNNANFAWVQHMLHHLAPQGTMAFL